MNVSLHLGGIQSTSTTYLSLHRFSSSIIDSQTVTSSAFDPTEVSEITAGSTERVLMLLSGPAEEAGSISQ